LEQRLLTPERLRDLPSSWLDHTKHAVGRVGCQPHLPVPTSNGNGAPDMNMMGTVITGTLLFR
ncbi:hypothetical protein, partial [Altericroceibacterium endophyticum]|uniref:hypothetical protein n=1 Tax=Altericroceibacterium endophyticum TaxID=1808508 RepID=UPI001F161774